MILYSCQTKTDNAKKNEISKDNIKSLINQSYDKSINKVQKLEILEKAYEQILSKKIDSVKPMDLSSIAYRYYELGETTKFLDINKQTLIQANKKKDSFVIGDAHWSYANYYNDLESYQKSYYHYNQALFQFNSLGKEYQTARMLYAMAFIKGRYKDYSGSEVLIYQAIKKFEKLENHEFLFESFNHLGLLQLDIEEYKKALDFFEKAKSFIRKLPNKNKFYSTVNNNIGLVHLNQKEYSMAQTYFELCISKAQKNSSKYARYLDNLAYTKLLKFDTINVENDLILALKLRDSLNNKAGILKSKSRLSEYYKFKKDTIRALKYAQEANDLAKKIKNGGNYLETLQQLADLQPNKANKYMKLYSHFSDSLTNAERKTLNKFTRIEFETDEIIEKNEILTQQRIWIFSASVALILILSLLYFLRVQRVKNEKLFLETEQQKANEQVYLLTLKQQATLEEEKARERNRISQELHDGILGRLFGTRVGLGFLDLNADEKTQEQHEAFLDELQDIEKEIREVSHKLNDNFADPDVNFTSIVTQLLESKSQIGDFQFHLNIDENMGINHIISCEKLFHYFKKS